PLPGLLLVTAGFSLLPDVDSVVGLLSGDFGRFHNNATHSLFVGTAVSLLFGAGMKWRRGRGFRFWSVVALACYSLHILMDAATWGRGVMALWPFTQNRFHFPFILFYGLHWSQGWLSARHLWTLLTETLFVVLVVAVLSFLGVRAKRDA
ncbi:MAG TPA: metal-dependent hydrolase, partial [Chloroflexota bacterium]|nr:metal-dependent hydrolase [Chloroflexota bacterium]